MKIEPFAIEAYFALYEFSTPYLLCASDCETVTVAELLEVAGQSLAELGERRLGYTESQGDPALREAIAATYEDVSADEIVVLTSPEEGIYLTLRALLDPGDHVVVLTPAYGSLLNLAKHVSGNVSQWEIKADQRGWHIDLTELEALVTLQTKLIIINFPHNPTGFMPDRQQQEAIVAIAQRNGAWLFSDEMYRGLELYGRETLPSAATITKRGLALAGLSKVHGLPGLRAGWLVVHDRTVRAELLNWKFYTSICPPAPTEFLALAAVKAQERLVERNRRLIEDNLATAERFFERWPDLFDWRPPQAGSIALVGLNKPSAELYCHRLAREAGVLLLPSNLIGYDDRHVRMGFGRANFAEALAQFAAYLEREEAHE